MTLTVRLSMLAAAAVMAGCATQPQPAAAPVAATPAQATTPVAAGAAPSAAAMAKEFYAVLTEDGRIYAFGDAKNYKDYQAHGEVTLTRTRVGEGPGGRTLVFGITPDDVKGNKPSLGEQVMSGALAPAPDFYGEVFKGGRYFIFGNLKDMKDFIAVGEVPYSYTDIGAGPQGETLVYVMNKDSYAKGKPQDRIERFKALRVAAK